MDYDAILRELNQMNESSTSRILQHLSDESNCAIISPFKEDYSEKENMERMKSIKSDVRRLGLGFVEFISRWAADDIQVDERSLLVPHIDKEDAMYLGKKYRQSSIIYKDNSGCFEICTTPFDGFQDGDVVQKFINTGDHILNIEQARDILNKKRGGAVSMPVKGGMPFTLGTITEMFEVEQPRPSYFQKDERITKIY